MPSREALLVRTFVEVTDTLVADFDVVDLLTSLAAHCVEIFDASQAGILLADRDGGLQVVASSSATMEHLELFELQHDEGPCIDCFRSGRFVASVDLNADRDLWPRFAPEALNAGLHAAWAIPMRLRELDDRFTQPAAIRTRHALRTRSHRGPGTGRRRHGLAHPTSGRRGRTSTLRPAPNCPRESRRHRASQGRPRGTPSNIDGQIVHGSACVPRRTNQRLTDVATSVARRDQGIVAKIANSSP